MSGQVSGRCLCSSSMETVAAGLDDVQLLHPDSGDPSGDHRSVLRDAAEPADTKVESHQRRSTMFHTPSSDRLAW